MSRKKRNTSRVTIGGILIIISGAIGIIGTLIYWIGAVNNSIDTSQIPYIVPTLIFDMPIISLVIAILALIGGIFTLRKKNWAYSLAAAFAAILSFIPTGVAAALMILPSKNEFNQPNKEKKNR